MSDENRNIALGLIEAMSNNDTAKLDELLDPEVRHWIPRSAQARAGGVELPISGREAVKALIDRGGKRYEYIRFSPLFSVADEGGAAVYAETDSRLAADGRELQNSYCFFVRIEAGRVVELWEQPDTARAFEFFGI